MGKDSKACSKCRAALAQHQQGCPACGWQQAPRTFDRARRTIWPNALTR